MTGKREERFDGVLGRFFRLCLRCRMVDGRQLHANVDDVNAAAVRPGGHETAAFDGSDPLKREKGKSVSIAFGISVRFTRIRLTPPSC